MTDEININIDATSETAREMRSRFLTLVSAASGGDKVLVPEREEANDG